MSELKCYVVKDKTQNIDNQDLGVVCFSPDSESAITVAWNDYYNSAESRDDENLVAERCEKGDSYAFDGRHYEEGYSSDFDEEIVYWELGLKTPSSFKFKCKKCARYMYHSLPQSSHAHSDICRKCIQSASEIGQLGQSNRKIIDEKLRRYEKAHTVLAEHQKLVTIAQAGAARGLVSDKAVLLVAKLADALEGGQNG